MILLIILHVIENNNRKSKYNYSSRALYSIENIILENKMIHNYSLLSRKIITCNMIDLKSCYY